MKWEFFIRGLIVQYNIKLQYIHSKVNYPKHEKKIKLHQTIVLLVLLFEKLGHK